VQKIQHVNTTIYFRFSAYKHPYICWEISIQIPMLSAVKTVATHSIYAEKKTAVTCLLCVENLHQTWPCWDWFEVTKHPLLGCFSSQQHSWWSRWWATTTSTPSWVILGRDPRSTNTLYGLFYTQTKHTQISHKLIKQNKPLNM